MLQRLLTVPSKERPEVKVAMPHPLPDLPDIVVDQDWQQHEEKQEQVPTAASTSRV